MGLVFVAVCGLYLVVMSMGPPLSTCSLPAAMACCRVLGLQSPWRVGSAVVALRLTSPAACGIIPDRGWNPCPLHWRILNHWTTKEVPQ